MSIYINPLCIAFLCVVAYVCAANEDEPRVAKDRVSAKMKISESVDQLKEDSSKLEFAIYLSAAEDGKVKISAKKAKQLLSHVKKTLRAIEKNKNDAVSEDILNAANEVYRTAKRARDIGETMKNSIKKTISVSDMARELHNELKIYEEGVEKAIAASKAGESEIFSDDRAHGGEENEQFNLAKVLDNVKNHLRKGEKEAGEKDQMNSYETVAQADARLKAIAKHNKERIEFILDLAAKTEAYTTLSFNTVKEANKAIAQAKQIMKDSKYTFDDSSQMMNIITAYFVLVLGAVFVICV